MSGIINTLADECHYLLTDAITKDRSLDCSESTETFNRRGLSPFIPNLKALVTLTVTPRFLKKSQKYYQHPVWPYSAVGSTT